MAGLQTEICRYKYHNNNSLVELSDFFVLHTHYTDSFTECVKYYVCIYIYIYIYTVCHYHHHKHQGLDPLIRSVSTVTAARANASSVFQLFSFLGVCSGMISKRFGFVAFFASVKASSVCIHLSCLVCL